MRAIDTYILILFLFPVSLSGQQKKDVLISGTYKDLNFSDFSSLLEKEYNVQFFFKEEWVDSLKINLVAQSLLLSQLMDQVLVATLLDYIIASPGTVFILPDKKFAHELPYFHFPEEERATSTPSQTKGMEEKYLQGRKPDMIETIVVGSMDKAKQGGSAVITGKVTEEESGEPLIGATIYLPNMHKGAATDNYGRLTLSLKPGIYLAVFQCMGMAEIKGNLDVRSDGYFSIGMKEQAQAIEEVIVKGEETVKRGARLGLENVSSKTIKELPALMGEKDVMKIAQMLPGIVSTGEGSGGINVRGGNADQNLFYINEVPVYNSSHLFGFFSSINSDIIDNFSVFKGHVPAEYGGRLASVFNVETRKGNKNKFFTQGGISPIAANAEIELPLLKEKISMMLSARSSYSDWILGRLKDPDLRSSKASFNDFAGALDFNLNLQNQLGFFFYRSQDSFHLSGFTQYGYSNLGASVNYLHHFSPRLKSVISLICANYKFETTEKRLASEAYQHAYKLDHYEFRGNLNWISGEQHSLKGGLNGILYNLDRGSVEAYDSESLRNPVVLGKEQGIESAVFLEDNIVIGERIDLSAGLRYSVFTELGTKTVRNYFPGTPKDDQYVSGIKTYQDKEKIVNYQRPEFRFAFEYRIGIFNAIKLSATQMTQYLFMLSNTISIAPNDQWKLVDSHIKPPRSTQYSAGFYRKIPTTGLTASGEFYYKKTNNIIDYKDGADFLASPYVETAILQGDQEAYGAEFMLSRETGRLNGWSSYTYSRSMITINGSSDWADINQGKTYPSNYDKPHVFNLVLNYKFNRRFSLSSNLVYYSGRPTTIPESIYYIDEQPFVEYSDRNQYRIPDYFRTDMSLKIEGNLKLQKPMHSYWLISIYNMTGRSNANSIFFVSEDGYIRGYKYSVISVPIFTISWNWKLGNYANN